VPRHVRVGGVGKWEVVRVGEPSPKPAPGAAARSADPERRHPACRSACVPLAARGATVMRRLMASRRQAGSTALRQAGCLRYGRGSAARTLAARSFSPSRRNSLFVTPWSPQLPCVVRRRRVHGRKGIAGTRAFRDGVAERGGNCSQLQKPPKISAHESSAPPPKPPHLFVYHPKNGMITRLTESLVRPFRVPFADSTALRHCLWCRHACHT